MKAPKLKGEGMTAKDAERLILQAVKEGDEEFHLALVLARYMGLRVGETLHLRVGDVDWPKGTLKTRTARTPMSSDEAAVVHCDCGIYGNKVAALDVLPIPIAVKATLGGRLIVLKGATVNAWLFPSRQDPKKHTTRAGISWTFKQLAGRAGLPHRRDGMASLRLLFLEDALKTWKTSEGVQEAMRLHSKVSAKRLREKA